MSARKPGEWVVVADDHTVSVSEVRADGTSIAIADMRVGYFFGDLPRAKLRAQAMAAAPDLLEALQDLFGADMEYHLRGDGKDDQIEAIAKARAAIAKATGG